MEDLSLHILDIVENSINAEANLVKISIIQDLDKDELLLHIKDNGKGMSKEFLDKVDDPFTTTRTTRRVGMGIPLLKHAVEETEGTFEISSSVGKGTEINAVFKNSHIDRKPLGDIASTMITLILGNPGIDFIFVMNYEDKEVEIDTAEIKSTLDGVEITHPEVLKAIKKLFD